MATIVPIADDSTNAKSLSDTRTASAIKSDHGGQVSVQALGVNVASKEPITKGDRLAANQQLNVNEQLISPNGFFRLVLQDDSNFVLYGPRGPLWASATDYRQVTRALLLPTGNLVLLVSTLREVMWESKSKTDPNDNPVLILQDDGNLVITTSKNKVIWSTDTRQPLPKTKTDRLEVGQGLYARGFYADESITSPNGKWTLSLADDRDICLKGPGGLKWSAGSGSEFIRYEKGWLELRTGAKLVLVVSGIDRWSASTWVSGGSNSVLLLQDDGNLCLMSDGLLIWSPTMRDCLYRDNKIHIEQALVTGDWRLSFASIRKTGLIQAGNVKTGQITWYYVELDYGEEAVKYFHFTKAAALCFKDRNDNIIGTIVPRLRNLITLPDGYDTKTRFTFHPDGWGRIYLEDKEQWSFNDLARGPNPTPPPYNNFLRPGMQLYRGMGITSSNTQYWFGLRGDGSLAIIEKDAVVWTPPGNVKGDVLTLQEDANLVLYGGGKAQWAINTVSIKSPWGVEVVMQNDRNLALFIASNKIWDSDTSPFYKWGNE